MAALRAAFEQTTPSAPAAQAPLLTKEGNARSPENVSVITRPELRLAALFWTAVLAKEGNSAKPQRYDGYRAKRSSRN
jgi:hypothetical protein